jgi:hypothetical protein
MSISNLVKMDKNFIMCRISRDLAQVLYLLVTLVGLTGRTTGIYLGNTRFTLDHLTVSVVGVCCCVMSLSLLSNWIGDGFLVLIDFIANASASFYLVIIYTNYYNQQ